MSHWNLNKYLQCLDLLDFLKTKICCGSGCNWVQESPPTTLHIQAGAGVCIHYPQCTGGCRSNQLQPSSMYISLSQNLAACLYRDNQNWNDAYLHECVVAWMSIWSTFSISLECGKHHWKPVCIYTDTIWWFAWNFWQTTRYYQFTPLVQSCCWCSCWGIDGSSSLLLVMKVMVLKCELLS